LIIGIPREVLGGERRVALVPDAVKTLVDQGLEVLVQSGAGEESGFPDSQYEDAGARLASSAAQVLGGADVVLKVQPPQPLSSGENGHEVDLITEGAALICHLKPLDELDLAERLAKRRVNAFSMEFMPRITRAQSMDALSSQSNLAGYEAVLLAATALPRILPMMVTAAGTLKPSHALIIGAGVAGLQALGTAKRLGAITSAYDTRPVVKEQVESLGARFVQLALETGDAEDAGGYAKAQSEEFYQRQRELLGEYVAKSDIVVTTALVPGQPAPLLIEERAVQAMRPGSVIVDLAAEKGGNCELTEADRVVVCAGAWTPKLLPWLGDRLHVVGLPVLYFGAERLEDFSVPSFPPWAADIAGSGWYGFPALRDGRVKIGYHGRGIPCDPDRRGTVSDTHVARARAFLRESIPGLAEAPLLGGRVCLYCDAFDGDFLIAEDPDREGVVVAGGGSGHAFKFAPVLGGLVADAVERRPSRWSSRFAWRAAGGHDREDARYSGD